MSFLSAMDGVTLNNEPSKMIYEQPVNEHTRVCLRLEYLFEQFHYHFEQPTTANHQTAITTLTDILNILDRPDLKNKLLQEFRRQHSQISRLADSPHIDPNKLQSTLSDLIEFCNELQSFTGKLGQNLRGQEFLSHIRQHLLSPGGLSNCDSPIFHFWLTQSIELRQKQLSSWWTELSLIRRIVNTVLRLVRQSNISEMVVAHQGFYQSALDPQQACQLVRVVISPELGIFPEISVGKHRLYVRFCVPNIPDRPTQTQKDVGFELIRCII